MAKPRVLGIIPAREGSKSIPNKNIVTVAGKPLIYYIITTSLKAVEKGILTKVVVSTDSLEIAQIARKFGAEVPFMRPKKYAQDNSPDIDFMKHAYLEIKKLGFEADILVNLRPTSPLLTVEEIKEAIDILIKSGGSSVRSVSPLEHNSHPYWLKKVNGDKTFPFLDGYDENKYFNRQTLPPLYKLNAAVDVFWAENTLKGDLYGKDMRLYIMKQNFLDINNNYDLIVIKELLNER